MLKKKAEMPILVVIVALAFIYSCKELLILFTDPHHSYTVKINLFTSKYTHIFSFGFSEVILWIHPQTQRKPINVSDM